MIDYSYYHDVYGGRVLTEETYPLYARRAAQYVASLLLEVPEEPNDAMKMAACAVADDLMTLDNEHGGITAESTDGYSVSYAGKNSPAKQLAQTARLYLTAQAQTALGGRWV